MRLNMKKNLIIVGGTSFYLKTLIEGISLGIATNEPLDISVHEAYELLYAHDKEYMQRIAKKTTDIGLKKSLQHL